MRKSNWIILAILAVAAGFFLWLWYYLGFNFVDDPFDLVLAVAWWAVVLVLVFGIRAAESKRRCRVRTAYLAPGILFNSEAGYVNLSAFKEGTTLADALEYTLAGLTYAFDRKDPASDERGATSGLEGAPVSEAGADPASGERLAAAEPQGAARFDCIVRTDKFDKDDVDKWEGEVVDVKTKRAVPFKGKEELSELLATQPA